MDKRELLASLSEIAPRTVRQITGKPAPQDVSEVYALMRELKALGLVAVPSGWGRYSGGYRANTGFLRTSKGTRVLQAGGGWKWMIYEDGE